MNKKLNCVLLIDDDASTNFLHSIILEDINFTEHLKVVQSGKEALRFLTQKIDDDYVQPDIIFLDINMPAMNGWEFLEEYEKFSDLQKARIILFMLTTSSNPADKEKAEKSSIISGFFNKPLTEEILNEILQQHFST